MRDVKLEDTFYHHFTTRQFSDGVPTTLAGSPVLSVLEENNATPITAGVSINVDRASVVGLNEATIVATAANGYEAGKSYSIYISTGTVGGVSVVGEVVGHFTVQAAPVNWARVTAPTTAVDLSATDIQLCDTVTTLTGHTAQTGDSFARIGATGSGLTSLAQASVATEARLAELDAANIPADVDAILVDTGTTLDNHLTDIKGTGFVKDTHSLIDIETYVDILDDGTSGNAKIATDAAAILADTGTDGVVVAAGSKTGYSLTATTGLGNQTANITGNLSGSVGSVTGAVGSVTGAVGSVTGSVGSVVGHTAQTGDTFAKFAGITLLAEWLGLLAGKQAADATALTEIKATGAGSGTYSETTDSLEALRDTAPMGTAMRGTDNAALASVATEARLAELDAANLPSDVDAILVDTGTTIPALLPAALVGGRIDANVGAISADATAADRLEAMMDGVLICQVNDASATTTAFAADGFTEATDDHFNGRLITFISGALVGQQTDITDYDAADHAQGAQAFVVTALTEAPANNDFFIVH